MLANLLQRGLWLGVGGAWLRVSADFCGVKIPTMTDFKVGTSQRAAHKTPANLTIGLPSRYEFHHSTAPGFVMIINAQSGETIYLIRLTPTREMTQYHRLCLLLA